MVDLKTSYMGLKLKNPVIAGASNLMLDLNNIKKMEKAGAAAIVYKSLFEEQIELEKLQLDDMIEEYSERNAEMVNIFPRMEHAGPLEYLVRLKKVKQSVSIPVIGSLNAVNRDTWIEYARKIEETGVDGIELNLFYIPRDTGRDGILVENEQLEIVKTVVGSLSIPVAVKLSSFYSNPLNLVKKMDLLGPGGFVLFNRLFQPDIDTGKQEQSFPFRLSSPGYHRLPLRFTGLLYGNINADICSSSGVFEAEDIIKLLLAGASCTQCVSTLYKNGIGHIGTMLEEVGEWMKDKGYKSLGDFRGKLSLKQQKDPFAYQRAQYVDLLMKGKPVIKEFNR
ncbi:MAG: dihydroorotate dehydrogenase-like protein [Actinomycetota bacterium]|nr:MAG: dihydroorotate dehydrogenase-like protein [Actinomycetota bacterium]